MNKAQRQEAARKRPLMSQPTIEERIRIRALEWGCWPLDQRTKPERAIDNLVARAARRRSHQHRGR